MSRPDVAGVDLVVVEVLAFQVAGLVADQAVFGDRGGVEFDLDLHVAGDRQERRAHLVDEHLARLVQGVDVGGVAVADLRELLHQRIVVVAPAEAEDAQAHAGSAPALHQLMQRLLVHGADVEVAVGGEDDAVDAAGLEVLAGDGVGEADPLAAVGGAAGREPVEGGQDRRLAIAGRRFEHLAGRAGVHHDGDGVLRPELRRQQLHRGLEQGQLVGVLHRPGDVDQEYEVRGRQPGVRRLVPLDADVQEMPVRVPGAGADLGVHGEGMRCVAGRRVGVVEVVHDLLDAHRVIGRDLAPLEETADVGVGRGIDVDGEGGDRRLGHALHRVVVEVGITLAIGHGVRRVRMGRLGDGRGHCREP